MVMVDTISVTLIRHGLTRFNEESRYIGSTDLPLSKKGVEQTNRLALLLNTSPDLLVTSDLMRCQQTMSLLYPNLPFQKSKQLREYDFGLWEGKTYEQLKSDKTYQSWLLNPLTTSPPQGETLSVFQQRVEEGFHLVIKKAIDQRKEHVAVITHGGVIRHWLSVYAPVKRTFFEWDASIGNIFTLKAKHQDLGRGERFTSLQEERFTEKING
ncbi:histidine phosphatase family protein [Bacillus solitudinis]|uniref:histidine phosphatase family protein n=1 Tax=Bacillus solitudinis TaxID=2014074 RepID=UPI000C245492|nr:histidine phosphatase family protein [Bacillus solitudinis]